MRELKVVGLDVDGKRIICEADGSAEKFILLSDDRLRAAVRGEKTVLDSNPSCCRGPKRAASQGDSSQDQVGRLSRAGCGSCRCRYREGRKVCPSGVAGAISRGRAGNRRSSRACRRSFGDDAVGDGDVGSGGPRAGSRGHQLGRVAQRGRPLDGADGLEGRLVRQRRALPVHAWRAWRHRRRHSTTRHAS